jgi:hypothetical protein
MTTAIRFVYALFITELFDYQGITPLTHIPKRLHGALLLVLAVSLPVPAAEWSAEPTISFRSGYNDNIRMTTQEHDSVWEATVTPALKFGVAEENRGLYGKADVAIRRYSGGDGNESSDVLDREDAHFNVNAYHRTPRNEFRGLINLTRDSTLDEVDETGEFIEKSATRIIKTINPGWSFNLTQLTRLDTDYSFTTVDFSDEDLFVNDRRLTGNVEYDYHVASGSVTHAFTPKIQASLASSWSSYQPETNLDSDTLSVQAGITHIFSETLTTSWLAGMRRTNSDTAKQIPTGFCIGANPGAKFPECTGGFPVITGFDISKDDTSDTGTVYKASITKLLESGKLSLTASRVSTPASDGNLNDTTRFIFNGDHRITATLRASLRAEYSKIETISSATAGLIERDDRTIYRIIPSLSWRWSRQWVISGQYEYANKDEDNESGTATRNAVYLSLTYRPDKLFTSR